MAKQKKQSKADSKSPLAHGEPDPELEKKVDALMSTEIQDSPPPDVAAAKKITVSEDKPDDEAVPVEVISPASAPLLPTDRLPILDKPESKTPEPEEPLVEPEPTIKLAPLPEEKSEITSSVEDSLPEITKESVAASEDLPPDTLGLESPETNKAVDEIIANEADTLLDIQDGKVEDETSAAAPPPKQPKEGFGQRLKGFFSAWWHNPLARWATIFVLVAGIGAAAALPTSRYYVLNTVGVRSASSLVVFDQKTSQPLKNVDVSLGGQTGKTDKGGKVRLEKIKLGSQDLVISKPAFAEVSKKIVVGWGSNPLGDFKLAAVGSQYTFLLTDFLSGKPVLAAEASSGIASARTNEKGEAVLVVPESGASEIEVTITADSYRTETLKLSVSTKESQSLKLVPSRKHVFVSKRSGTFDVYKIDIDGKNEEKILAGAGSEKQDGMVLVPHQSKNVVGLVSTRGPTKNQDGFLLSTLNVVDVNTKQVTKVVDSERIQIVDWVGDKLVYVKITQGASAADPSRHKLMSFDLDSGNSKELASTNYFNDVMVAKGAVYYSPAVYKVNGSVGLFRINPDGTNKKTIYDKEAWNLFRTAYDKISVSVGQDWFEYSLADEKFAKASSPPAMLKSRVYSESPDGKRSLWTDERDGKGVLLAYDHDSKEDKAAQTQRGLKNPIYWLDNDHAVYRVSSGNETADYVLSLSGGTPLKIKDVTDIAGLDRWYYY
jgi:hypothetical protein